MAKRYVHNDTDQVRFIGGTMLPPGEGREVDEQFLPPGDEATAADAVSDDAAGGDDIVRDGIDYAALVLLPLSKLMPQLKGLGDEDLKDLAAHENARETPRVTLLNAIGEQQLQRAQARTDVPDSAD